MNISRNHIISGPALIKFGGQSFWSKGDVTVTFPQKRYTLATAHHGKLGERVTDRRVVVSFEPSGRLTAGQIPLLWPYASHSPGVSLYSAVDVPLVVHGMDGVKLTVKASAVTQMPSIRFSTNNTAVGQVQFTGLVAEGMSPLAENLFTFERATYPGDAGFAPGNIVTAAPEITWQTQTFQTEGGVEIKFGLRVTEHAVDGIGTVDMKLAGVDVSATMIPVGLTAESMAGYLVDAGELGADPLTMGNLLICANTTPAPQVTLSQAYLSDIQLRYGTAKRVGSCTWTASRSFIADLMDPLFWITLTA